MDYKEAVKKIKERCQRGDVKAICDRAKCTPTLFYNACKHESWQALSPGELNVVNTAFMFLKERDETREGLSVAIETL